MKIASLLAATFLALSVSVVAQNNDSLNNRINRRRFNNSGQGFGQGKVNNNNNGANGNNGNNAGAANSTAAGSASNATATATGVNNSTAGAAASSVANSATGSASNATGANSDAQTSLSLDPQVIATGFANNGQDVPTAGQVASLTSTNNFINFCLTVPNLPITNGKQIATGSCNPAPMGVIPASTNMPSVKFIFPKNGDTSLGENEPFTISMAIENFQSGNFVNADENYFSAPQEVNSQGLIIGHSHVVVEALTALDQTTPLDPLKFAFFKGLNSAAVNGILTANVTAGLPAGFYKLSSINTAANHQPVLVPIAQHGSLDDAVYFTVGGGGAGSSTSATASETASSTASADPVTVSTAAAPNSLAAPAGKRFNTRTLH